jgi:hypothetical protein
MTDLQLGLLLLGIAAVVGVLAYNRWQERSARRQAEAAFRAEHPDVLLEEGARREPQMGSMPGPLPTGPMPAAAGPHPAGEILPDPRIDYVIVLRVPAGVPGVSALEAWRAVEHRFGKRALLAGSGSAGWKRVVPGGFETFNALQAALQLVSRGGVVGDTELIEFRTEVETMAARMGAEVSAPEMRLALESARKLDELCAETDIQVALHLVKPGADEALHREAAAEADDGAYQVVARADGATLLLDMPRTMNVMQAYAAMARQALHLASRLEAQLLDDRGHPLDERALSVIATQLEPLRRRLADAGIEPGGSLALRLFS